MDARQFLIRICGSLLVSLAHSTFAQTGAPCDASIEIKGCRARVDVEGKWLVVRSETPRCSKVDWSYDGSPRQTTVIDGEERLEILGAMPKQLEVERCMEVKDLRDREPMPKDDEASGDLVKMSVTCHCDDGRKFPPQSIVGHSVDEIREIGEKQCSETCDQAYAAESAARGERAKQCNDMYKHLISEMQVVSQLSTNASTHRGSKAEVCAQFPIDLDLWENKVREVEREYDRLAPCLSKENRDEPSQFRQKMTAQIADAHAQYRSKCGR